MDGPSPNNVVVRESLIVPFAKIIGFTLIFVIFDVLAVYLGSSLLFVIIEFVHLSFIVYIILRWYYDYYEISLDEIIIKKGIIFTDKQVYLLKNIESVELKEGLIDKIFNIGDISLYLPKLRKTVNMNYVSKPNHYLDLLQSSLREQDQWKGNY